MLRAAMATSSEPSVAKGIFFGNKLILTSSPYVRSIGAKRSGSRPPAVHEVLLTILL